MALLQSRMKCTVFCLVILAVVTHFNEVYGVDRNKRDLGDFGFWEPIPTPPPYVPEKPKNVTCVLDNYESADCDWCPDEEPEQMTIWVFQYINLLTQKWKNCTVYRNKGKLGLCICHLCGIGDEVYQKCANKSGNKIEFIRNRIYTIRIHAISYPSVVTSDNFTVHFSPKLAKPKPVRELSTTVQSKDAIDVNWTHPLRLEPDVLPLNYFISYKPLGTPISSLESTVKVVNTSNSNYTLTGLRAFMEYNISVQCSPPNGIYYSTEEFRTNTTLEGAPSKPVQIGQGGFKVNGLSCAGTPCRAVKLFWKNIDEAHQNGIIVNYTVSYNSSTEGSQLVFPLPSWGSLLYSATIYLNTGEAYSVSVVSSTVAGASPPAYVFIDSTSKMPPYPNNIEMEYLEKNDGVSVSWSSPPGGATGFTLHHCLSGHNQGCAGDMFHHFITASDNQTDYRLAVVIEKADSNIYGLSTERGVSSSGMNPVWQCVYDYHGVSGPPVFDGSSAQQERSLKVIWQKVECSEKNRGRVIQYVLFWCRVGDCDKNIEITVNHTETEYIIRELVPHTLYMVNMAAESNGGRGAAGEPKTLRTVESKPDDSPFNFTITEVTGSNISCSWQTSLIPNGRIIRHEVYVKDLNRKPIMDETKHVFFGNSATATIKNLTGYTNYSLQVASCNNAGCSERSYAQTAQTKIRAPPQVTHVKVKINDDDDKTKRNKAMVMWSRPDPPNGPISFYQIQVSGDYKKTVEVANSSTSYVIEVECQRSNINVSFSVLAVTEDESKDLFFGVPSEPEYLDMCNGDYFPLALVITLTSVLGIVAVIIIFFSCRYFRRKLFGKEPITVPDRPQKIPAMEKPEDEMEYISQLPSPTSSESMLLPHELLNESSTEDALPSSSSSSHHQGGISENGEIAGQRSLSGTVIGGLYANEAGAVCNGDIRGAIQPDLHNGVSGQPADLSGQPGQRTEDAVASVRDSVDSYCRVAVEGNATLSPDYIVVDAEVLTSGGSVVSSVADYSRLAAPLPLQAPPPPHPPLPAAAGNGQDNQNMADSGQAETSGESLGYSRFTVNPAAQPGDVHNIIEMNVMSQAGAVTVGRVHIPQSHPVIPGNINFDGSLANSHLQKQSQSEPQLSALSEKNAESASSDAGPSKPKVDYTPLSKLTHEKMSSPRGSCSGLSYSDSSHSISSMDYDDQSDNDHSEPSSEQIPNQSDSHHLDDKLAIIMPVEELSVDLPSVKIMSRNGTGHTSGLGSSRENAESWSETSASANSGDKLAASINWSGSMDSGHSSNPQRSHRSFQNMIEPPGMTFSRNVNNNNNESCDASEVVITENGYVPHFFMHT